MARGVGTGRPIEFPKGLPKYKLPTQIAPQDLKYFSPPKGIDVVTPLDSLPRELSPLITNLVLDRGVLRSRYGTETYHNNDSGTAIQLTTDLSGTVSLTNPTLTARTTANQGAKDGWVDPDGVDDGMNSAAGGRGTVTVPAGSRLYNVLGDPTAGTNLPAYDSRYTLTFRVKIDPNTINVVPINVWIAKASVSLEYSTDGGANWTALSGTYESSTNSSNPQVVTNIFSPTVVIPGNPSQIRIRLILSSIVSLPQGGLTGATTVIATAIVFNSAWPSDAYPVTWNTATVPLLRIPIRWTGTHLQVYTDPLDISATWTIVYTFPATQLNSDNTLPTYVTWAGGLISTDVGNSLVGGAGSPIGSKGLISTILVSPWTTTILAQSPRAAHIAVFGNRVVASRTNDWTAGSDPWVTAVTNFSRVRWSVKNNSNDWAGIGSGFEDLIVPGGLTDEVMGVYPVSDETAIVVSERSVRRMDVTGFVDAPFRFALLTQSLGTLSRYSIRLVPGGVIFLSYDDAILYTLDGPKRLGTSALRDSLKLITNPRLACGYYDQYNSRYLVGFKEGSQQVLWSFSFLDGGWTRLNLPFDIVSIDRAYLVDVNGVTAYVVYLTQLANNGYSCRENPSRTQDVTISGANTDSEIEARTGLIVLDPLRKTEVVEIQLVYESTATQLLTFEYSSDKGATWLNYSQASVSPTSGPTVLSVRRAVEQARIQLRMKSSTLGQLKVISFHAFASAGAMIHA